MKILVLAPRPLWPPHDGGTVASLRCISGLAAAGAEVTVLSMKTEKHNSAPGNTIDSIPDWLSEYRTTSVNTKIRPLKLICNLLFSGHPYDLARFRSPDYSEALHKILSGNKFDIIHCEGLVFALYLDEIRKYTTAPVSLRAHNLEHRIRKMMAAVEHSTLQRYYFNNLAGRLKRLEISVTGRFDAIVPISRPDYDWFSAVAQGKPVFLCETGAGETGYLPEPAEVPARVGFIGSMNWQPNTGGLNWFIESVWPSVLQKIPGATLRIAGRHSDKARALLSGGKNISFEGEPDDARSFIASNNVMIAPLFAGSGLRIKIIDALSTGRPVVATPVAAEGIEGGTDSGLVVAADAESFCTAILRYLEDPELRTTAGKEAVRLVRSRYDNQTLTTGLSEFYARLARPGPSDKTQH